MKQGNFPAARWPAFKVELPTAFVTLAVALACAESRPCPASAPQVATAPVGQAGSAQLRKDALARLSSAVETIDPKAERPDYRVLARVLRGMATTVELLAKPPAGTADKLREIAGRLEDPAASPLDRSAGVKEALAAVLQSLFVRAAPSDREPEYRNAVEALRRAADAVRADSPPSELSATIAAAMRAATDAVYVASDSDAPFREPEVAGKPQVAQVGAFEDEVAQARKDVLELGSLGWSNTRENAARALSSLADAVQAADRSHSVADKIADARFQVERLRLAQALSFGQARWLKAGLSSVLDALDTLHFSEGSLAGPWIREARQAVAGIRESEAIAFQRAAVQDGFRTTVDVLVVATQVEADRH